MNGKQYYQPRKIRFWEYFNGGYVKITLKHGQTLSHYRGGLDDEGWSAEHCKWAFDTDGNEPVLTHQWMNEGRDCDGYLKRSGISIARADRVTFVAAKDYSKPRPEPLLLWDGKPVMVPDWKKVSLGQRDEYAERMGY